MDLHALLVECALQEGFPLASTVDLELAFSDPSGSVQKHIQHFDHWLQSGFAGSMDYLARGRDRRADPRLLFPEAQSILCVAIPYPRRPAGAESTPKGPRYARYLQGKDYHIEITEKLERVMTTAKSRWSSATLSWKVCVDTSAVLERSWAALAGLGWIGKNTLLINPKLGSYLFLGEVLINQKTNRGPSLLPNYCGNCTRCLTACPTQAFQKPHTLDSNRCISYLTLEKRGEIPLSEKDRTKIGGWIAGCDICQEVCPFNIKPSRTVEPPLPENATTLKTWQALLRETPEGYKARVKNSAMKRIKPAQFSRNLAITLRNTLSESKGENLEEFRNTLLPLIQERIDLESDESLRNEWKKCRDSL